MGYSTKYRIRYTNYTGDSVVVSLQEKDYSGSVIYVNGSVSPVRYNMPSVDLYEPIRGSEITIQLMAETKGQFDEINESASKKWKVVYSQLGTNAWSWVGFVVPYGSYRPIVHAPYVVEITAVCGLGFLKNYDYSDNGAFYGGFETQLKILDNCLSKIDVMLITEGINIYETNHSSAATDSPLEQTYINQRVFRNTKKRDVDVDYTRTTSIPGFYRGRYSGRVKMNEKFIKCDEVVRSILFTYGAIIYMYDSQWQIARISEINTSYQTRSWAFGNTQTGSSINNAAVLDVDEEMNVNLPDMNSFIEKSARIERTQPPRKIILNKKINGNKKLLSLVQSDDFEQFNNVTDVDITQLSTYYTPFTDDENKESYLTVTIYRSDATLIDSFIRYDAGRIVQNSDQRLQLQITSFSNLNTSKWHVRLVIHKDSGDKIYLQEVESEEEDRKSEWVESYAQIINFDIPTYFPPGETYEPESVLFENITIPATGNLYLEIGTFYGGIAGIAPGNFRIDWKESFLNLTGLFLDTKEESELINEDNYKEDVYDLEFIDSTGQDNEQMFSNQHLYYYDGTKYLMTSDWGTGGNLSYHLLQDMKTLKARPRQVLTGELIAHINPEKVLNYKNRLYLLQQLNYNSKYAKCEIEAIEIEDNNTNNVLLLEDGSDFLLESGQELLLE